MIGEVEEYVQKGETNLRNLNRFAGILIVTLYMTGCSKGHEKEHAQSIELMKIVKFGGSHYGCTSAETLDQAESFRNSGQSEQFQNLIRMGSCKWLPSEKGFTVISKGKENKDSIVLGVVDDPSKASFVFYTRYEYKN